jgi:hypothetical protein
MSSRIPHLSAANSSRNAPFSGASPSKNAPAPPPSPGLAPPPSPGKYEPAPGTSPGPWDRQAEGLVGIGATIASALSPDGLLVITRVKPGCNAATLGIQPGDRILEIANTRVITGQAARDLILGQPGTFLEMSILRGSAIKEFSVQRLRPCCISAVRQDLILRKMASALIDTSKRDSFERWIKVVDDAKEHMRLLKKAAGKIMRAKVAAALFTWQSMVAELKRSREVARKVFSRIKSAKLAGAFTTWADHKGNVERARECCKKVILRILNKIKSSAFDSWSATTARSRHNRAVLTRTAQKWKNASILGAFLSWSDFALDQREAKERERMLEIEAKNEHYRKQCVMQRVAKHWKCRSLSKMFGSWVFKTEETQRARALCKRAAGRIIQMRAARAFLTWNEKVSQSLHYKVTNDHPRITLSATIACIVGCI